MNLRIIPAVQSSPTVIFSLSWHNLPPTIPLPSYFQSQITACQEASIPTPRNTLAMDKAVGFHLLLDSVTFDLARKVVAVAWLDRRTTEWSIDEFADLGKSLEDVLNCVKQSGEEAIKEKAAAQQMNAAKAAPSPVPSPSASSSTSDLPASIPQLSAHKRHRTASGIFSSLVASFIPQTEQARPTRRNGKTSPTPIVHKHHIFHPTNKRETFPANAVPQSRFLRRQARAKLVDIFRYYVASRITADMRMHGIVGEELKRRGILDDIDVDDDEEHSFTPGQSGYAAAGGYVAFMARSMLRTAFAEAKSDENDSWSSSSEDSLLLTPKNGSNTSLPSDTSSAAKKSRPSSPAPRPSTPATTRRRASAPSPQARQISHLSSVLIGLTQKDKRSASDEREMLELVKERSLRRRWSTCEARPSPLWTKPTVSSPLRNVYVADEDDDDDEIIVVRGSPTEQSNIPFPAEGTITVSFPSTVAPTPRRTQSLPAPPPAAIEEDITEKADEDTSLPPKAAEAEDVFPSRSRRSSILVPSSPAPSTSASSSTVSFTSRPPLAPIQTSNSEDADLMASLPSPKYTEEDEKRFLSAMGVPRDVDSESDDGDDKVEVSPPPQYAAVPSDVSAPAHCFRDVDIKKSGEIRGLELDTAGQDEGVSPTYWTRIPDGILIA